MKRWISLFLSLILVFSFFPAAFAKGTVQGHVMEKGKGKKKEKTSKITGRVTSFDSTSGKLSIDANGKPIELVIDSATTIKITGSKKGALTDIWVGDRAQAEYTLKNEVNVAKKIDVKKQKGSVKGSVEAIDAATQTLTVSGKQVVILEQTVIRLSDKNVVFEDIEAQDKIDASGFMKDGILQASTVKIKRQADVIKGEVESIDAEASLIVVDGKDIFVTEETNIRLNGEESSLEEIFTGDKIVATGKKQDGQFTAKAVSIHREPVEIEGTIESIDVVANTITIDGKTLSVNENTKIESDDDDVDLIDLMTGMEAEAKVWQKGENEWIAVKIKVELDEDDEDDEDEDDEDEDENQEGEDD